ncbi:putative chalcone--flavonone isomerase 3 [Abeliophyllum distichum]|uniref:Chalcone-flavonone isomerase family protein n=1 Tax=Abeliophyllum distichum TaxID=126358 RepID=A0ABD1W049_9LAMI
MWRHLVPSQDSGPFILWARCLHITSGQSYLVPLVCRRTFSGITDIEIHFLQIKFTAIGVYLDPQIVAHLQQWKGKTGTDQAEDDDFFEALITAPIDKFLRVVVIKEIKGSQYGVQLESVVRDWLATVDKYEDEEEAALEQVVEFF